MYTEIKSPDMTHVPHLEQSAVNPMPKTSNWKDLRLLRFDGTDLYAWYGKDHSNGFTIFEDLASGPFHMTVRD